MPAGEGWQYLAGHEEDPFTNEIVGYAMRERLTQNLVKQFLLQSITNQETGERVTAKHNAGGNRPKRLSLLGMPLRWWGARQ